MDRLLKQLAKGDGGLSVLHDVARIKATEGPRDLSTNLDRYLYGGSEPLEAGRHF